MTDDSSAWDDYRRRVQWLWGVWIGGFGALGLLTFSLGWMRHGEVVLKILSVSWIAAFLVVALRLSWFRCPRCQRTFFSTTWRYNPLARKCVHCGLRKGQS